MKTQKLERRAKVTNFARTGSAEEPETHGYFGAPGLFGGVTFLWVCGAVRMPMIGLPECGWWLPAVCALRLLQSLG